MKRCPKRQGKECVQDCAWFDKNAGECSVLSTALALHDMKDAINQIFNQFLLLVTEVYTTESTTINIEKPFPSSLFPGDMDNDDDIPF